MKFIFYSIIAVLAIVAGVVAFRLADQGTPAPAVTQSANVQEVSIKTADVLVARVNIPLGTIIDSSMVDRQPWPENLVLDSFVLGDNAGQEVIGKIARSAIQAHEPFMKGKLANPNDPGFLAAGLPVGMRAITIATDVVSGIAGFVFPGDRVDILFTHNVPGIAKSEIGSKPSNAEVLGANVRVLAVNIREGDPSKPAAVTPSSVTVEVSDELAQRVRLAEKNGTLSLALRSIHDDNQNYPNPTGLKDLSHVSVEEPPSLMVVRGPGGVGGKITSSNVIGDVSKDNTVETTVIRGGGSEDISAQPGLSPQNQVNNNNHNSAR
jgi:pilus assembly protein CpaB